MSGILMMPRGASSPEPPYTLARGGPKAPLRSRDSLAALARGKTASRALTSLEIGAVVQARDPEYEADQEEEPEHGPRNDLRREAERRREGVRRVVAHDAVDMPMLAEAGANVAHQSHEPGEGDRDEDQDVLRDPRDLPPAHLAGPHRSMEQKDVDGGDRHHGNEDGADLRHRQPDANRRLDKLPVDAKEDHDERGRREDRELRRVARLRPRHRRDLSRPSIQQKAHERREDQDVHGGVLGGHHAEVAKNRVRPSSHRPEFRHGRDNRSRRCPDHEAERDRDEKVLDELLKRLHALDAAHPQPEVVVGGGEEIPDQNSLDDEEPREGTAHHRESERL